MPVQNRVSEDLVLAAVVEHGPESLPLGGVHGDGNGHRGPLSPPGQYCDGRRATTCGFYVRGKTLWACPDQPWPESRAATGPTMDLTTVEQSLSAVAQPNITIR